MTNVDSGEVYYSRDINYSFNISIRPDLDAGMRRVIEAIKSALRGSRIKNEPIQLSLIFNASNNQRFDELPFPITCEDIEQKF